MHLRHSRAAAATGTIDTSPRTLPVGACRDGIVRIRTPLRPRSREQRSLDAGEVEGDEVDSRSDPGSAVDTNRGRPVCTGGRKEITQLGGTPEQSVFVQGCGSRNIDGAGNVARLERLTAVRRGQGPADIEYP